jgi:hypothetical protein
MGFLDFMNTPQDPQGIDPNYGVSNQQMYDARMDSMGSLGALLLASGQRMMPNERAAMLAKIGSIPGQMNQQLDTMSQAQLRSAQARAAQQQLLMQQNIMKQLGVDMGGGQPASPAAPSTGATIGTAATPNAAPMSPAQTTLATPTAVSTAAPTSQSALAAMDPQARALLLLGATSKPEEAAKTIISATQTANEPTSFDITDPQGRVRTVQTTKGQAPALMQKYQTSGFTLGKPVLNEEQNTRLKALGEQSTAIETAANDAQDLNARLTNMDVARAGFAPGKGSKQYYDAAAWLNSYLPGSFLPEGMSSDKVASYQDFSKLATQYATEQARKLGAREAASVVNMMVQANPNAEMTPQALQDITNGLRAQNDFVIAKADAKKTYMDDKGSLEGFDSYWRKTARPEQFMMKYLTPERISSLPTPVLKQLMGQ